MYFRPKKLLGWGVPQRHPGVPENLAEISIFVKFGRNLWVCRLGAPHPKIFGGPKVMTLIYLHAKYLGLTLKTHRDTSDQSLVLFYPIFGYSKNHQFQFP